MRAEVLREIAAMLDHPNVYMGGPSQRNMRRAEQIYAAVAPLIAAAERERAALLLEAAAERVAPTGKRSNQIDRHVADVLRDKAGAIRAMGDDKESA